MMKLNIQMFADGGKLIIGTGLDTKDLEKDLKKAESELRRYEREAERLTKQKAKADIDLTAYNEQKAQIKELTDESLRYAQTQNEVENHLRQENTMLSELDQKYSKQLGTLNEINSKIERNSLNQGLQKQNIEEINQKLGRTKFNVADVKAQLSGIGNGIQNITHKVVKWGLAVFSIRSAYRFVRQAVSELTAHNEQLATDIEYVRYALASLLEPVILKIVALAQKLLYYIAYVITAWTGKNPFANVNKGLEKTNSGLKSATKQAQELRKQLAGFDEMNVLGDNVSAAGGGGGVGGVSTPSIDLSNLDGIKIPKWLEWIAKNKKIVLGFFKGLATAIASLKIAKFIANLMKLNGAMKTTKTIGIALMIEGIVLLVKNIFDLITKWDELSTKEKIWKVALAALGAAMIAFGYAVAAGISAATLGIGAIIAAIATLITAIGSYIVKSYKEIKAINSVEQAEKDLEDQKKKTKEAYDEYISAVDRQTEAQRNLKELMSQYNITQDELNRIVKIGDDNYSLLNETEREVYKAHRGLKQSTDDLKESTKTLTTEQLKQELQEKSMKLSVGGTAKEYDTYKQKVVNAYKNGQISASEARVYLGRAMKGMSDDTRKTFEKDIPNSIKSSITPNKYNFWFATFKNAWNKFINGLSRKVEVSASVNTKTGKKSAKGAIVTPPKLAVGGVVSRPGQGVNLGNAIIGEAGAEGVIPLTDSQQMALLGEAIGRYITINASITNTMNGRVISREIQKIQNQTDFAANR